MQRMKVMLVDDDRDWVESMADLFEAYGYEVEVVLDGGAALRRFRERDYDIAFMDVRMPVMNGVDSFFAIRQMKPTARIVMMTGFKEPIMQKAVDAGALGPLHKPFTIDAMLKLVEAGH